MSKGLEALKRIEIDMEYVTRLDFVEPIVRGEVQQELYKIYYREEKDLDIIEKELKALEIIKTRKVNVYDEIVDTDDYETYIGYYKQAQEIFNLTEEEYDLLKEVLL